MRKRKIIIDTDPGHDDALALLLLLLCDQFDVLAITTVAGNSTIENVTRNAQAIVDLVGVKIPVFSGLSSPLKRKLITAVVHGESGLDGLDTSTIHPRLTGDAMVKIISIIQKNPGEVTLLTLGPLTNIARALKQEPELSKKIAGIVMMGGAIDVPGNKNRVAEFNFFVDPEAADIVFSSTVRKTLVPLDTCNNVILQIDDFSRIKNKKLRETLIPLMQHFAHGLSADEKMTGLLVYDALAAYYLLNPRAYTITPMNIVIETRGKYTFGMSVAEKRTYKTEKPNVDVVTAINDRQFRDDFFRILSSAPL